MGRTGGAFNGSKGLMGTIRESGRPLLDTESIRLSDLVEIDGS